MCALCACDFVGVCNGVAVCCSSTRAVLCISIAPSAAVPFLWQDDTAELNFAGVQGQHMVLRMDNESTLLALWNKAGKDRTFPALSLHVDAVAKGRPQQKGLVEVGVRHLKEGNTLIENEM